ncbi:MAG: hypothetical protein K9M15_02475 [Candidatus Marinimicrobia bacterium]|nr:hypothetical protein [Candidatus Neomarinimicrobiota bacterium]
MTPYATKYVSREEITLFEKIRYSTIRLPDIDLGLDEKGKEVIFSCHMLARAVAKVFGLKYVDGYYTPNFEHSWILTPEKHLIDVYPIAVIGGPILMVSEKFNSPARWHYKKMSTRKISYGRFSKPSFRRSVRRIEKAIRNIL